MKVCFLFVLVFLFSMSVSGQKENISDGPFEQYHKNGQLKTVGQYKNKERVGKWTSYYDNGNISSTYSYSDGKRDEEITNYYKNGNARYEVKKINDVFVVKGFYENGKLFYERILNKGYYKEYFEDEALKIESNYVDGSLSGIWKQYYPTGQLEWEVTYKNDNKEGFYKQFYENGKLKLEGETKEDLKDGNEKQYNESGNLTWAGDYSKNQLDGVWEHSGVDGSLIEKVKYKNGELKSEGSLIALTNTEIPDGVIERVPIFPGCERFSGNMLKKTCMSQNIARFVSERFNTSFGSELGLTGKQKIYVIFKIDKTGGVTGVDAKSNHISLNAEAIRIIGLLPKMTPGVVRGKPVVVPYSLPITLDLKNVKPK
ncbi:antitoxin component YwqK of YwqJK toxin-antitoxin module [Mariniflexile fucanivorans]|uniref:Antitoxin component YwqK of YwqJK toxin-antitoxin module n=1 Tax=Mariniflexile fucanivorans TaxID=264023 RepID=A0A4R1RHT2_9FLAO|nr:hypothetical protein [Mariniflexile fucanivorans]TCL65633.1 antitoxin component YwqK of YwqJK toxin-antitoxin module [Mariniflexile fucanivorans]